MIINTVNLTSFIWLIDISFKIGLVFLIVLTPSFIAYKNGLGREQIVIVRLSSILLGWTIIGYLFALFYSIKK